MIDINKITKYIRTAAKSNYWQTIYSQSKETYGLQLFDNKKGFTYLQIMFLNNLSFYNSLYLDIALGEVDRFVLGDNIYEDAYMYYRNKEQRKISKKEFSNMKSNIGKLNKLNKESNVKTSEWVFRTKIGRDK